MNPIKQFCTLLPILALVTALPSTASEHNRISVYTPLSEQNCVTVKQWEQGVEQECPGIGGYRVRLLDDDARQSLTLIKDGESHPLNLWSTVSGNFSVMGKLIEWRVSVDKDIGEIVPAALIVRHISEGQRKTSNLAVVDLRRKNICVVAVIPPKKKQNLTARNMADQASRLQCR